MARKLFIGFIVFLLIVLVSAGGVYFFYTDSLKAVNTQAETIEYTIDADTTVDQLTKDLQEQGIIKNAFVMKFVAKQNNLTDIKAGRFLISSAMTPLEILTILNDYDNALPETDRQYSMQFIEGKWAKDYALVIGSNENNDFTTQQVLNKWNDEAFIRELIDEYEVLTEEILNPSARVYLEGYLSPNKYAFFKEATIEDITRTLIEPTNTFYLQNKEAFEKSSLTVYEVFTLASMVEYEASLEADQELVASVFFNRLAIGQRLESSVTLCYALYNFNDWKECEQNPTIDSPYNTYMNDGLPVGPVTNPTESALLAVLNPIESEYYYFVANVGKGGDGKVYFSTTYDEHKELVNKYLKEINE